MALVMVERKFEAVPDHAALQAREDACSWCLSTQRVRLLRKFLSADKLHTVSMYEAPDAEAVRVTQRTADLPVEHVWTATPVINAPCEAPRGYSLVVVQRAMPAETTLPHVQYMATDPTGCGKRLRLAHIGAFLALDCSRLCCVFYSPDLESVRVSSRELGVPIERLWTAQVVEASA